MRCDSSKKTNHPSTLFDAALKLLTIEEKSASPQKKTTLVRSPCRHKHLMFKSAGFSRW